MIDFAKPLRWTIRKKAECHHCGKIIVRRPRKYRLTKLARRHPWFHVTTLKEQCEGRSISSLERQTGMTWLQPLEPVVYDQSSMDSGDWP